MKALVLSTDEECIFKILEIRLGLYKAILIEIKIQVTNLFNVAEGVVDDGNDHQVVEDVEFHWEI